MAVDPDGDPQTKDGADIINMSLGSSSAKQTSPLTIATNAAVDANAGLVKMTANLNWEIQASSDFTGDGDPDVLMRNSTNGKWYLYSLKGKTRQDHDSDFVLPENHDLNWQWLRNIRTQ